MPFDNKLLRPKPAAVTDAGPDTDPPIQLKAENNSVLVTEGGVEICTE